MAIAGNTDAAAGIFDISFGSVSDIVQWVRDVGNDTAFVEVKSAVGGLPVSVWETVSAFSNTQGGIIILGLDESKRFAPAQGFDPKRVRDAMIAGLEPGPGERVVPLPHYVIDLATIDGVTIVVVDIGPLEGRHQPCYVKARGIEQGSYVRVGDADKRMSPYQVYLRRSNREQPVDDRIVVAEAHVADFDADLLGAYLRRLRQTGRAALSDQPSQAEALLRLGITDHDGAPTLAGIMTFGAYPQQFFPQLIVSVAAFPTLSAAVADLGLRMLDNRVVDGAIPVMVAKTVDIITANLRMPVLDQGLGGVSVPEIPVGVLREAVVNAVMHRDYGPYARGSQVRVEVFPNRIEVINPGGIWGGRSLSELLRGQSNSRNAILAALLQDATYPGTGEIIAENKGTGLRRMMNLMRQAGFPIPLLEDRGTEFCVTLWRQGLLDPTTRAWLSAIGASALPRPQLAALATVWRNGNIDDVALMFQEAMSQDDAQTTLGSLARDGWLEPEERNKGIFRLAATHSRESSALANFTTAVPLSSLATAASPADPVRPTSVGSSVPISSGGSRGAIKDRILEALSVASEPLSIRALADALGLAPAQLRAPLRALVASGLVVPTAPPTSRTRKYVRS
jgi:ATP-dependent DNA helicase RecG